MDGRPFAAGTPGGVGEGAPRFLWGYAAERFCVIKLLMGRCPKKIMEKVFTMNFVISYSGGKDSVLSLHKMLEGGHTPMGLLVMVNQEQQRSWFHGVDLELLRQIAASLEIPLLPCESGGAAGSIGQYQRNHCPRVSMCN